MTADEFTAENYGDYPVYPEGIAEVVAEAQEYFEWELAAAADEAYDAGVQEGVYSLTDVIIGIVNKEIALVEVSE